MTKFEEIDKARKIFGISDEVTFDEIREKYISLIRKFHPDKKGEENKAKEVNWAYETLKKYFYNYKLSLRKESIEKADLEGKLKKQFFDDWLSK